TAPRATRSAGRTRRPRCPGSEASRTRAPDRPRRPSPSWTACPRRTDPAPVLRDVDQGGDVGAAPFVGDRLLPDPFSPLRGPRRAFDEARGEEEHHTGDRKHRERPGSFARGSEPLELAP